MVAPRAVACDRSSRTRSAAASPRFMPLRVRQNGRHGSVSTSRSALNPLNVSRQRTSLAGASDVLCRLTFSGFNALRLVDTEPCRPFCRTRKGMNLGEAAALLVLEDLSHATARGATIYAEIAGYGVRCEAYHPTA